MVHEMKLQSRYFEYIQNGTKRIELRLNDEKRQEIKLGDKILFLKEPEKVETMEAKVVGLISYSSFEELFNDFDISILADKEMAKVELLDVLQQFYTIEDQKKYGVLGIRIELI